MISPKHLATFLLGAAAGAAIVKYNSMSKEEQEALVNGLKQKAQDAQDEAKQAASQLQDYFENLRDKGQEALKTHVGNAEQMVNDFIANISKPKTDNTSATS